MNRFIVANSEKCIGCRTCEVACVVAHQQEQDCAQLSAEAFLPRIQVVKGDVTVNGEAATTSDAFAVWDEKSLNIKASSDAEILLFDLPPV